MSADVKPQHDFRRAVTPTDELAECKRRLYEIQREALRARARLESEPGSTARALESIALTAGASLTDLKGPREGRWV